MPLDYPTLRVLWWLLLGLLLIGFAIMDGFDLGTGILLPFVARTDDERRVVLNTVGPVWEGNQVWLLLGAGAIFAAWPAIYAVTFSGLYFAMMALLLALILRPVGFKYRSKLHEPVWRTIWDVSLFLAGFLPVVLLSVALGNVMQGIPFHFDDTLRCFYTGTFWALLNPFALLCAAVGVALLTMHGATYLSNKTEGAIQARSITFGRVSALIFMVLFAVAGVWIATRLPGYHIVSTIVENGPSNPLYKQVEHVSGAWFHNYQQHPSWLVIPLFGFLGAFFTVTFLTFRYCRSAWLSSACCVFSAIATVGVSMFPFILPSNTHPSMSLTVWDASSSQETLWLMLVATIIFLPLILIYTSWVYHVLRGKVTLDYVAKNKTNVY